MCDFFFWLKKMGLIRWRALYAAPLRLYCQKVGKETKKSGRSVIWHHHLLCSTFDKVFLLNTKRRRLCRCCFFSYTVFFSYFFSLDSGRILPMYHAQQFNVQCAIFTRYRLMLRVLHLEAHTSAMHACQQRRLNANHVRIEWKAKHGLTVFHSIGCFSCESVACSLSISLKAIFAHFFKSRKIHNDNIKRWNCFKAGFSFAKQQKKTSYKKIITNLLLKTLSNRFVSYQFNEISSSRSVILCLNIWILLSSFFIYFGSVFFSHVSRCSPILYDDIITAQPKAFLVVSIAWAHTHYSLSDQVFRRFWTVSFFLLITCRKSHLSRILWKYHKIVAYLSCFEGTTKYDTFFSRKLNNIL